MPVKDPISAGVQIGLLEIANKPAAPRSVRHTPHVAFYTEAEENG